MNEWVAEHWLAAVLERGGELGQNNEFPMAMRKRRSAGRDIVVVGRRRKVCACVCVRWSLFGQRNFFILCVFSCSGRQKNFYCIFQSRDALSWISLGAAARRLWAYRLTMVYLPRNISTSQFPIGIFKTRNIFFLGYSNFRLKSAEQDTCSCCGSFL